MGASLLAVAKSIYFIFKEGREGRLLSFCLEPINMNSVLVIFSINLLAVSQRFLLSKSPFRED